MSYSIEKLPGEPIVIGSMFEGFSMDNHLSGMLDELGALLDSQPEPILYISDAQIPLTLEDILKVANMSARGQNPIMQHPNMRRMVLVTSSDLVKLAAKGMDSDIFGNLQIDVFKTVDEALAFLRQ